jgi:conjugal transfer pilus assembly protein TraL
MTIEMPKYIDDQLQMLWWEMDEFMVMLLVAGIGMIFNLLGTGMLIGVFVIPLLRKAKRVSLNGAALHIIVATGFVPLNKEFDDSAEKEFYF